MSLLGKLFGKKSSALTTTQIRAGGETSIVAEAAFLDKIPFLSGKTFKQKKRMLAAVWLIVGTLSFAILAFSYFLSEFANDRMRISTELQMLTQRAAIVSTQSTRGDSGSIVTLKDTYDNIEKNINAMNNGRGLLPRVRGTAKTKFDVFMFTWSDLEPSIKVILDNKDKLTVMTDSVDKVIDDLNAVSLMTEKIDILMMQRGSSRLEDLMMTSIANAVKEMQQMASNLSTASVLSVNTKVDLERNMQNSKQIIKYMLEGNTTDGFDPVKDPKVIEKLESLKKLVSILDQDMNIVLSIIDDVAKAKQASLSISGKAEAALSQNTEMVAYLSSVDRANAKYVAVAGGVAAIIALIFGFLFFVVTLAESKSINSQIEESILSLMNDLAQIADGDLTTRTHVSEDMTGAIADSVNFTVVRLGDTMSQVQKSADKVTDAANEAKKQTEEARDIVIGQAQQIQDAASGVLSLTDSIQSISMTADESADVAHEALKVSDDGKKAVANAIGGMDLIRNEIQETSKRIKRLGESSQEVGEIVTLISDMTEQTNVLALNASIQAAAAGEAGRGFRAVATEVQRLAERSEGALKRIVALIQSIQSDTQNAVAAMERSTQKVVEGTQITNKAGEALDKIESVSKNLAGLIESISRATTEQNTEADTMTERIHEVLKIAHTTTEEMEETAKKIVGITTLADELRESVAGFKL